MKEFLDEYGETIIATIAAAMIFSILYFGVRGGFIADFVKNIMKGAV